MPPKPAYAPQSPTIRQRSPVNRPSSVSPSSTYSTWPRPCIESIASDRVSVAFTGRPSRRATATATVCSTGSPALPPNAPPTNGAMTRTRFLSSWKVRAMAARAPCGIWVET